MAASVGGIRSQGEFAAVIRNSQAMADRYRRVSRRLAAVEPLTADRVAPVLDEFAEVMLTQTLDWNVMFQVRPVRLP